MTEKKYILLTLSLPELENLMERVYNRCLENKSPPPLQDELLTIEETAAIFGRSKQSLYSWLKPDSKYYNTMPKPIRRGRSIFFSKKEILTYRSEILNFKK